MNPKKKVKHVIVWAGIAIASLLSLALISVTSKCEAPENTTIKATAAETADAAVSPEPTVFPAAPSMMIGNTGQSAETGCYQSGFPLNLSAGDGLKIYYTLDGSDPTDPENTGRAEFSSAINITDRSNDENVVAAVEPAAFDCAYATWDKNTKTMGDNYATPDKKNVDKATIVRAVTYDEATQSYSSVTTNTYFIGDMKKHISGIADSASAAGIPLSIMSISTDYANLFDEEKGIYVKGNIFQQAFDENNLAETTRSQSIVNDTRKLAANYSQKGKEWERPAHIDYIESNGETTEVKLQQDCGLRIQGNYSRSDLQKSFRLYARKEYGKKNFVYDFFNGAAKDEKNEPVTKFKKLVLRNGGNDSFIAKYRDTYWQTLFSELSCDVMASRACIVYIDGEYHGLYVLQEDLGDDYAEKHHGIDKTDYGIVTVKGDHERNKDTGYEIDDGEDLLPEGEDKTYFFKDLIEFFDTHNSCQSQKNYDALAKIVDPDSCMDYFASEIFINNKWDWPGKNWYLWKTTKTPENADTSNPYGDGRWRFALCDMDFGGWSGASEGYTNTLNAEKDLLDLNYADPKDHAGVLIIKSFAYFMSNETFRTHFLERMDEIVTKIANAETATALADKFADTYDPLFKQFYDRFMSRTWVSVKDKDTKETTLQLTEQNTDKQVTNAKSVRNTLISFATVRVKEIYDIVKETVEEKAETYAKEDPDGYAEMLQEKGIVLPTPTASSGYQGTPVPSVNSTEAPVSPVPSATPAASSKTPTVKISMKSNRKKIIITTTKKAKVTIKFSKKVAYNSGKKVKQIKSLTIKAAKNKTGKITLTFKKKLPKKTKITVKATKNKKSKTLKKTL